MLSRVPSISALELLSAVAESGSLTAAAERVHMAQSNATTLMQRLEGLMGRSLLERQQSGTVLTQHGVALLDAARPLLREHRQFKETFAALRTEVEGTLVVACSKTIAEYLLPGWLSQLRIQHPEFRVATRAESSAEVAATVRSGAANIGFVEGPEVPDGLVGRPIRRDRLVVVVAPNHPWATRKIPVTRSELASTPLVLRENGSGTRACYEKACEPLAVVPPALELGSNAAILSTVGTGLAPSVVSEIAAGPLLENSRLVEVAVPDIDFTRDLHAVWDGDWVLSASAAAVLAIASENGPQSSTARAL